MSRSFSGKIILVVLFLMGVDICWASAAGAFRPVATYLWVMYVAFHWPAKELLPTAIFVGILRDLTGSLPLGVETVSLAAMAASLIFLLQKFQRDSFLIQWIIGIFFVLAVSLSNLFLSAFLGSGTSLTWFSFLSCLGASVATALIMPLFFWLTSRWFYRETTALKRQYELFG